MNGENLTVSMFISVVPSQLVAKLQGGSFLTIHQTAMITLNASQSYDPDDSSDTTSVFFSWSCMEGRPDLTDISGEFPTTSASTLMSKFTTGLSGVLTAHASNFPTGTYTFRVKVYKDTRSTYTTQALSITSGYTPAIMIEYVHVSFNFSLFTFHSIFINKYT